MITRAQRTKGGFLRRIAIGFALMVVGIVMAIASATPASADHRLTICHATGSDSNPYVLITPAKAAVANGHYGSGHQNGEDIIPEFDFRGTHYAAQGDQSILRNNCQKPTQTTTTSTHSTSTSTVTTHSTSTSTVTKTSQATVHQTQATVAKPTTVTRTVGPIPGAVDAGTNEASSWQLPVGGALIMLGAVGVASAVIRRNSAKR